MDTVRTIENNVYTIGSLQENNATTNDVSYILSAWLDANTEAINKQFESALSEISRSSSDGEKIAKLFAYNIIMQSLTYISSAERENVLRRQAEGIKAAKERGVRFGRQKIEIPPEFYPLYFRYKKGELSARKGGEKLNVSHSTFLKWIKETDKSA